MPLRRSPGSSRRGRILRCAAVATALAVLVAGCSGSGETDGGARLEDGSVPDESGAKARVEDGSMSIEENPGNELSAIVRVETGAPSRAGLTATAADHEVVLPATGEPSKVHDLALVGLRPETEYEVSVDALDVDGDPVDAGDSVSLTSGPLPEDFPPIELEVDAERAAEGLTLLSLKPWGPPNDGRAAPYEGPDRPKGYLAAVDHEGYVVWYHATDRGVLDARQTDTGFMFTYDEAVVREVDVLGRLTRELAGRVATDIAPVDFDGERRATDDATPMDTDSAHHEAGPLPSGNLLLLSTELRALTGPPQCGEGGDEVTYQVISDIVVEVEPDSGEIAGEWPLADVYDPFDRPGEELCVDGPEFAPPNYFYPVEAPRDWTHGNSVVLDEERNALIVSLRHLDAVLALRYQDDADGPAGELLWELGPDGTLPLDGEPTYYQHAAEVLDDGSILVYDNGNSRPGASVGGGGDPPYSRAVIYEVDDSGADRAEWTARQEWEHVLVDEGGRPVFTAFLGDVDALDTGSILITHGAIADERGNFNARVVEVSRGGETDGDVVFDLRVGDETTGWTVYRSERIASLTPGG